MQTLGRSGLDRRVISHATVVTPHDLATALTVTNVYWLALLAWDHPIEANDHRAMARVLYASGAVSVCLWGPECGQMVDLYNEVARETVADRTVIVTAHRGQTLEQAMWYLLHAAVPDDRLASQCDQAIIVTIGASDNSNAIADYVASQASTQ